MRDTIAQRGASPAGGHDAFALPDVPHGWHYVCPLGALRRPLEIRHGNHDYAAFVANGRPHVLDGRCPHMASRLARGRVEDDCLQCPLHGWRFRPNGTCAGTAAGDAPPPTARVTAYPTALVGGHVFFHSDAAFAGAMPFFDGALPDALVSAPPFTFDVEMPWWLASANGFDAQHFSAAHDRRLAGVPVVTREDTEFEARTSFDVTGGAWRDRLTRLVSGRRVEMTVRSVQGTLVLVTSQFRRSVTYGVVSIHPLGAARSRICVVIWMPRRRGPLAALDALDVRIRARFIRAFVQPDIEAGDGIRYDPARTIEADALLKRYLTWLQHAHAPVP